GLDGRDGLAIGGKREPQDGSVPDAPNSARRRQFAWRAEDQQPGQGENAQPEQPEPSGFPPGDVGAPHSGSARSRPGGPGNQPEIIRAAVHSRSTRGSLGVYPREKRWVHGGGSLEGISEADQDERRRLPFTVVFRKSGSPNISGTASGESPSMTEGA